MKPGATPRGAYASSSVPQWYVEATSEIKKEKKKEKDKKKSVRIATDSGELERPLTSPQIVSARSTQKTLEHSSTSPMKLYTTSTDLAHAMTRFRQSANRFSREFTFTDDNSELKTEQVSTEELLRAYEMGEEVVTDTPLLISRNLEGEELASNTGPQETKDALAWEKNRLNSDMPPAITSMYESSFDITHVLTDEKGPEDDEDAEKLAEGVGSQDEKITRILQETDEWLLQLSEFDPNQIETNEIVVFPSKTLKISQPGPQLDRVLGSGEPAADLAGYRDHVDPPPPCPLLQSRQNPRKMLDPYGPSADPDLRGRANLLASELPKQYSTRTFKEFLQQKNLPAPHFLRPPPSTGRADSVGQGGSASRP